MSEINQNTVKVWACGGAGINLANDIIKAQPNKVGTTIANLDITLVDTSESNYHRYQDNFDDNGINLVTIPNLDGSGQKRDENVSKIIPYIGNIVNNNKSDNPGLNIVIHSGSGGSGSILAPLLVKELLTNDLNTIVIMVGDSSTGVFAKNTQATIKTYESISRQLGKPIVARYYQNGVDNNSTKSRINSYIAYSILDYRMLFSGNIHGVDTSDLFNFLNYHRVTSSTPALTLLSSIALDKDDPNQLRSILDKELGVQYNVLAMVGIEPSNRETVQSVICDYRVDGQFDLPTKGDKQSSLYFVLTDNYFPQVVNKLDGILKEHQDRNKTRVVTQIDVGEADEHGLVF